MKLRRAAVLDAPGPARGLRLREVPVPTPRPGWALIAVKAFGLNRSELHSRLGLAEGMSWPRVRYSDPAHNQGQFRLIGLRFDGLGPLADDGRSGNQQRQGIGTRP